ncbi:HCL336Wp [Eremothecium sinecaudum]|uniref:HCL336Wp n=1 Tax=Eremothecium sinecaudum TaxID=45286 RepID=A0A120K1W4_9SACH|nr:HCL336Wp [Eremothecium sinecaudum]AMD19815.1 HCL336Wp [Eremothecium sinecaudum]
MMASQKSRVQLAPHDIPQFYLLIALYFLQGIPVGLAFGTVPFLLKTAAKNTSFTNLGLFSLATYPYSLKILWSPVVDAIYDRKIGRRRSWIIPVQLVSGLMLWILGYAISKGWVFKGVDSSYGGPELVKDSDVDLKTLTLCFLWLVFLCATQDIAVDGWALTILSEQSLSYASTAQTVGMNAGYFLSFSIFLTFNSNHFMNKYIRSTPLDYGLISFSGYLKFSGTVYFLVTLYVMLFTKEYPFKGNVLPLSAAAKKDDAFISIELTPAGAPVTDIEYTEDLFPGKTSLLNVYKTFLKVLRLPAVQSLVILHFVSKFAFQCNEGATSLKLLEKGFKREDLAITSLIDFPFEVIFGYYVAKWSSENAHSEPKRLPRFIRLLIGRPGVLTPWLVGFLGRIVAAIMGSYVVATFPEDGKITKGYFLTVIIQHLLGAFMATVQFVGISAFHTRIADPEIGGTYMTLLNTLSNFGGTWARALILPMVDYFTTYKCVYSDGTVSPFSLKQECLALGGNAVVTRDGYYVTNFLCVAIGLILYFLHICPKAQYLQSISTSMWRT